MSAPATPSASSPMANGGPPLAPNWKATKDANGQVYYYNRITRETRWDPPLAQPCPTAATASSPAVQPSQPVQNAISQAAAAVVTPSQPTVQPTSLSLSRHQSIEGSPSFARAANPSITERVATLSRSGHSQTDTSPASTGGTCSSSAIPPPPPDLPEAGTARKRVADLAQAFAQKTTTPTPPPGNKAASGATRKWAGSNNQLADQSTKRGSVYSSIQELNNQDASTVPSQADPSKSVLAANSAGPPPPATEAPPPMPAPPGAADPLPAPPPPPSQSTPLAQEPDLPLPPPPPPFDSEAFHTDPAPLPPAPSLPPAPAPTEAADKARPHPRTFSVSHVDSSEAKSAASAHASAGPQPHPRSMTISAGSSSPTRLPAFPPAPIETTFENDGNADQPLQRSKPPSPKKLRESTMSGFLVDLDKKLANSQGNIMVAASQAAAAANATSTSDREADPDANHRKSGVPSLSFAPPSATSPPAGGVVSQGGQSPVASPISPSPSAYNEFPSSPAESTDSVPSSEAPKEGGGLGGLLRRARSPSFSKPNKKDKSSKSKHSSPTDDSASTSSMDHLSLSQPDSPNLALRLPTSIADNTKPEKARPKSLVLNSLGIGSSGSSSSATDHSSSATSLSSSNPSVAAPTPNPSPASGNSAASTSGSKGALSWLFKKSSSDKSSSSSSSSPNSAPTSPDLAANVFGGSLSVLGAAGVHPLVTMCMAIVDERGPRVEGIYRLSGNAAAIQRHKAAWQQVSTGGAVPDVAAFDVNVVAGTLKLFLRELQDPVLTCNMYPEWVLAGKMESGPVRAGVIRGLIARLPAAHQDVLRVLMWHLHGLSKYADHTKMDTSNLAIVFGPTLVRPRVESMETMVNTEPQNAVVAEMIANVGEYFEPVEEEREEMTASPVRQSEPGVEASGGDQPKSPTAKFRPPKGALLVMPASPVGMPPKLPDLMPISPIDSPAVSREASGANGLGL